MKTKVWLLALIFTNTLYSQIKFQNATSTLLPDNHFSGSVIGISDLNADGLDDVMRFGNTNHLSIAFQKGASRQFTIKDFGDLAAYSIWNTSIGDINHDGINDFVIAANESKGYVYYGKITNGDLSYTIQPLDSSEKAYAQAGNLVDINNDGWIDYFLCNDIGLNLIWSNKGGQLTGNPVKWIDFRTTPESDNSGNYGSTWNDFDNDGDLDLYIAKCKAGARQPSDPRRINVYFRNNGNGTFSEIAGQNGLASGEQSWVAVAGDSDNDGDMDLFVVNHFSPCELLINDGNGKFTNQIGTSNITYSAIGVQAAWADFDNDGLLDLIIAGSQHHIYKNKGGNKFELIDSKELGLYQIESFALGDLNNDGKMDIYTAYGNIFNEASHRPDAVWLNTSTNSNHYIKIRLEGVRSNRSAVGARITVYAGNQRMTRDVQSGHSYGVHHSLVQHIGIGAATKIDSLVIRWPSGQKEKIESPFIDRTLFIKENTCFGFDPLLTVSPDKNVICSDKDSFKISVPLVGTYTWTNGATTKDIVVKSPGDYQVKLLNTNGCTLYSNIVSVFNDPKSRYTLNFTDTIICDGTKTTLNIPNNNKVVWNTGETTSSITVNKTGRYFATVNNECSTANTDTISVRTIFAGVEKVFNDTVPLSGKAILKANGNFLSWFSEQTGGNLLTTGNTYQTAPLTKTTTYYVQSIVKESGKKFNAGQKDFSGNTTLHAPTFSGALFFDVSKEINLKSVKVYTDSAGTREIDLVLPDGSIAQSKILRIEKGVSNIELNFTIKPGLGYKLTTNDDASIKVFGVKSPFLYRTEGAINYPLTSGPVTIYGTNAGPANYYYFYDWQLSYPDIVCTSDRIPVKAVLKSDAYNNFVDASTWKLFPNPASESLSVILNQSGFKNVKYELIDIIGKVHKTGILHPQLEISIHDVPSGQFFLKLYDNEKYSVKKFIKIN